GRTFQTGRVELDSEPGAPDIVTTRLTPRSAASSIEVKMSCACFRPSGSGSSGFPLQLSAVRVMPASLYRPRYSDLAVSLERRSSMGRCGVPTKPPELISA